MFVEHKEAGELLSPIRESLRITKLSQAMRDGAKLRPQAYIALFDDGKTCAIGAVAEARGWCPSDDYSAPRVIKDFVPELADQHMGQKGSLFYAIGSRNDDGMTRETIADWLESQGL